MIYPTENQPEVVAGLLTIFFLFVILIRYGKQVIEWALMNLYEFFILKN